MKAFEVTCAAVTFGMVGEMTTAARWTECKYQAHDKTEPREVKQHNNTGRVLHVRRADEKTIERTSCKRQGGLGNGDL